MMTLLKLVTGVGTAAAGVAAPVAQASQDPTLTVSLGTVLTSVGMICVGLGFVIRTVWSAASERSSVLQIQKSMAVEMQTLHITLNKHMDDGNEYWRRDDARKDLIEQRLARLEAKLEDVGSNTYKALSRKDEQNGNGNR
jgi:hypothetical protein